MSQSADHPAVELRPQESEPVGVPAEGSIEFPWISIWIGLLSISAMVAAAMVFWSGGAQGYFLTALAVAVCLVAAPFDGWTGRIPNALTYTAILLGMGLNALLPLLQLFHWQAAITWLGACGPSSSLTALGICCLLAVVSLIFSSELGDIKLLAAIGSMLGVRQGTIVLIFGLTIALLYAFLNLAIFGGLNRVFRLASTRLLELIYLRRIITPIPTAASSRVIAKIPLAVPMAAGLLLAQLWQLHMGGFFR